MSDKPEASDVQKLPPNNNILFAVIILIVVACAAAFVLLTPSDEQETRTEVEPAVKEQPMMELKPENDPVVDAPSVMPKTTGLLMCCFKFILQKNLPSLVFHMQRLKPYFRKLIPLKMYALQD